MATLTRSIAWLPNWSILSTAVHEVQQIALTGSQSGSVVEDWWLAADTGLPLRVDRRISIGTKSPVGTITYTENGSWQMSTLTAET